MQRNRPTLPHRPPSLPLRGGSCLLLWLYLFSATPLAPVLTALLAELDRSHHVAFQQAPGGLEVVLRHGCVNSSTHQHGMVARALTVFAQPTTASHPDHVIPFNATDTTSQTMAVVVPPPAQISVPGAFLPVRLHAPGLTALVAVFPRPPPAPSELLLTVGSTILVI